MFVRWGFDDDRARRGDTVEWVWSSGGHNVVADTTPEGSDWTGTMDAPTAVYDAGHAYSHTFEIAGTYSYYCNPHRGSGMTGEVVVEE
ncbi:plastocyanin/azurin family copper-binding protein [Halorubellus salinus]|uniref:plastocyanin/azurin family copper-binding protein n=1 Tax=Halorubellus salinus TaxID=755309 RepID=UPI001D073914